MMVCHLIDLDRQSNMLEQNGTTCLLVNRRSLSGKKNWLVRIRKEDSKPIVLDAHRCGRVYIQYICTISYNIK